MIRVNIFDHLKREDSYTKAYIKKKFKTSKILRATIDLKETVNEEVVCTK